MDILQALPLHNWSRLKESLRRDWPKYLFHYRWLDNAIKWKTKDPQLDVQIYCSNGEIESGVFVAVAVYGIRFVLVSAFDESTDLLQRVLLETKRFSWNEIIIAGRNCQLTLERVFEIKNKRVREKLIPENLFKSIDECLKYEILVPEGYVLRKLDESHTSFIHSLWQKNYIEGSFGYINLILRMNGGIGLFSKVDDSLVSWIAQNDFGGLAFLRTIEEHKRKGFARLMVQALSKSMAGGQDLDSILIVDNYNEASEKLFRSLGYECIGTTAWYIMQ